jgi:hypothetical protein
MLISRDNKATAMHAHQKHKRHDIIYIKTTASDAQSPDQHPTITVNMVIRILQKPSYNMLEL